MVTLLTSLLGSLVLILSSANACAEKPDYMKIIPECVHGDGGALCNGAIQRYHEQIAKKQLQHQYQQVLALISTTHQDTQGVSYLDDQRLVEAFKAQHKAWPKFMDAECELIGALSDGMSTWQSVRAVECERNLTEQRLKRFKHARACLEKIEPAKRLQEAKSCLYQLAPLAVPLKP